MFHLLISLASNLVFSLCAVRSQWYRLGIVSGKLALFDYDSS